MDMINVNEQLKRDIVSFVKNKIKDVKCVDEIDPRNTFKSSKIKMSDELANSYDDLRRFKIILQLYLNIFNHYDVYKEHNIKFLDTEMSHHAFLTSCYSYDEDCGLWVCHSRPEESAVVEAVYDYVLCFLSIGLKENSIKKRNVDGKGNVGKCTFCDNVIEQGQTVCGICDAVVDEMVIDDKEYQQEISGNNNEEGGRDLGNEQCSTGGQEIINDGNGSEMIESAGNVRMKRKATCSKCREEKSDSDDVCVRCSNAENRLNGNGQIVGVRWTCDICACVNDDSEEKCSACGGARRVGDTRADDNRWTCDKCTCMNDDTAEACSACYMVRRTRLVGDTRVSENRWTCHKCLCENDDCVEKCRECGGTGRVGDSTADDNRWTCSQCTCMNDDCVEECRACGVGRRVRQVKEVIIREDQWKCGKCELVQSYDVSVCCVCGASFGGNGLWSCSGCTFLNKSCNVQCTVCGVINDRLSKRDCQSDYKDRDNARVNLHQNAPRREDSKMTNESSNVRVDQWRCNHQNCRQWNVVDDQYCRVCHLYRFHSRFRGDPVKQLKNGEYRSIWICSTCHKFNDLSDDICGKKNCGKRRYERK